MPDRGGDVFERAVAAVLEQPVPRAAGRRRIDERPAVDEEDVLPAVAVVVEEQAAAAHDFRKVAGGAGAVDVAEVDAGRGATLTKPAAAGCGCADGSSVASARTAPTASAVASPGRPFCVTAARCALHAVLLQLLVDLLLASAVLSAAQGRIGLGHAQVDL